MKLIPFTFHNVSINSGYLLYESKPYPHNLHSIMYLLIRNIKSGILLIKKFTFHNVSINSSFHVCLPLFKTKFTFHNVSINSLRWKLHLVHLLHLHSIMYLLILRFFPHYQCNLTVIYIP